jgi:hypothetical protein
MTESVIAKLKSVVEPHPESVDALIDFSELVEFFFVDEADYRDLLVAKRA